MPTDMSLEIRESVVNHLRGYAPLVTAMGAATKINGTLVPANMARPFTRYELPDSTPYEATCYSGSEGLVRISVFTEGPTERPCAAICKLIVEAMASFVMQGTAMAIDCQWRRTNIRYDTGENQHLHGMVDFDITAVE